MPTTIPASPLAMSSSALRRWAVVWLPVSRATRVPVSAPPSMPPWARSPSIEVIVRWCWLASTSVGASNAACPPESTAASIARSATTVLPDPTSPWSRRCIGVTAPISAATVAPTSRWPAVSSKGSRASNASRSPPGRATRAVVDCADAARRRWARTHCSTKASSKRSLRRAASTSAHEAGVWMPRSAAVRDTSRLRLRTSSGSASGTSSSTSSTRRTLSVTVQVCSLPTDR